MKYSRVIVLVIFSACFSLIYTCNRPYCGPPKNNQQDTSSPPDNKKPPINTSCSVNLYLPFDGAISDKSTYSNTIITHGNIQKGAGKYGGANGALLLDGSTTYIEIPHNSNFVGTSLAVMAWVKPSAFKVYTNGIASVDDYSGFFNKWDNATKTGISTYSTYKQTRVNGQFANLGFYDFGTVKGIFLNLNQWQHVAYVIKSNGIIEHYLNGVKVATSNTGNTSGLITVNTPIEIGRTKWYPSSALMLSYFTGLIDEVKVYYDCPNIDIAKEM